MLPCNDLGYETLCHLAMSVRCSRMNPQPVHERIRLQAAHEHILALARFQYCGHDASNARGVPARGWVDRQKARANASRESDVLTRGTGIVTSGLQLRCSTHVHFKVGHTEHHRSREQM